MRHRLAAQQPQQPQQPPPTPGVPVPGQPRPAVEDASNERIPGFNAPGAGAAPPPGAPAAPGMGGGPGSGAAPTVVESNKGSYPVPAPTTNQGPAGY